MDWLFLAGAGVLGGLTGSIAGLASVATYPALLLVGLPPVTANVTNTVALVFNGVGSVWGSRPELEGQQKWITRIAPVAVLGGAAGAALLLSTPRGRFREGRADPSRPRVGRDPAAATRQSASPRR